MNKSIGCFTKRFIVFFYILCSFSNIFLIKAQAKDLPKYFISLQDLDIIKKGIIGNDTSLTLSPEELKDFKIAVENKVNELQNNIVIIGSKNEKEDIRNQAIKSALKLFIINAMMQVTNKNGNIKSYGVEDYFYRLMSLPYTKVEIRFYDLAYISNFRKGNDNRYHATATIFQEFKGFTGDNVTYTDRTSKSIDIILEYGEDEFFKVKRWIVKLGNIKINEIRL